MPLPVIAPQDLFNSLLLILGGEIVPSRDDLRDIKRICANLSDTEIRAQLVTAAGCAVDTAPAETVYVR